MPQLRQNLQTRQHNPKQNDTKLQPPLRKKMVLQKMRQKTKTIISQKLFTVKPLLSKQKT
jgi:hypothetical protein